MHPFESMFQRHRRKILNPIVLRKVVSDWQQNKATIDSAVGQVSSRPSLFNVMNVMMPTVREILKTEPSRLDNCLSTIQSIYCFIMYQHSKRIYDVRERLFQDLREVNFPDDAPIECLYLPEDHAPVIVLPDNHYYNWIVVCVDVGVDAMTLQPSKVLNIKAIGHSTTDNGVPDGGVFSDTIFTAVLEPGMTIAKALEYKNKANDYRTSEGYTKPHVMTESDKKDLNGLFGVLAYIKADRDIVTQVHPGKKKFKGWTLRALAQVTDYKPEQFSVGNGYSKIIENYEEECEAQAGFIGRAMRPHIRRPHAHLYHTKNGPIIHFLPPISVKGADMSTFDPERPMKILVK